MTNTKETRPENIESNRSKSTRSNRQNIAPYIGYKRYNCKYAEENNNKWVLIRKT